MVKQNKKNGSWKKDFTRSFNESLSYVSSHKKYVYLSMIIFFLSAVLGYFASSQLGFLDEQLREIFLKTQGLDALELLWFIFSNNVTSALSVLFLGAFFGIFPLFNAIFNGAVLGYVYSKAVPVAGLLVIWRILPHGIFELPAIFISLGLGIHLGMSFFNNEKMLTFKRRFRGSLKVFLALVVPLLMLAAIIESFLILFVG
ncbi:stage II sporulation protein M [Candidatus Pacearchaeota archaeon]|nr:stage II sporulation protein M [Candidatus Pacearchaeota archaeon]